MPYALNRNLWDAANVKGSNKILREFYFILIYYQALPNRLNIFNLMYLGMLQAKRVIFMYFLKKKKKKKI